MRGKNTNLRGSGGGGGTLVLFLFEEELEPQMFDKNNLRKKEVKGSCSSR